MEIRFLPSHLDRLTVVPAYLDRLMLFPSVVELPVIALSLSACHCNILIQFPFTSQASIVVLGLSSLYHRK